MSGTFSTDLSFTITSGAIKAVLNPNPPNTDLSLDVSWYCALLWFVPAIIGGAIALLVVSVVATIAYALTNSIMVSLVKQKPTDPAPIPIGFEGARWDSIAITAVIQPYLQLPQPDGTFQLLGRQPVTVSYAIIQDGSTLTLTDTSHYCSSLLIRVDCTDKSGAAVAAWLVPFFEGDIIEFGDDYKNYVWNCRVGLWALIQELKTLPQGVPRGGDPWDLSEAQVVQVIREAVLEGVPGLGAALSEATVRFGAGVRNEVFGSLLGAPGGGALAGKG